MLRYGFEEAGLEHVVGVPDRENTASRRVLEKVGIPFEGGALHEGRVEVRYSALASGRPTCSSGAPD